VFERFTKQARQVVRRAEQEARALRASAIGPEHLLLAVAEEMGPWPFVQPLGGHLHVHPIGVDLPVTADKIRALLSRRDPDAEALEAIGISLAEVRRKIEETFGPDTWEGFTERKRLPFTAEAKKVLELALREALELRNRRLTREHILLGLLREEGEATRIVAELGASPDDVREGLRITLGQMVRLATR
jgi:ATP-dependent Clp protease ATP-binding subunit ClpA